MIGGRGGGDGEREAISIFLKARSPGCVHYSRRGPKKIFLLPLCSASSSSSSSFTTLSTALLSVLFVVFHSLICSVITAKNDREQFLSISTRKNSLPALSSSGPPSSRGVLPLQQCTISIFRFQSSRNRGVGC